MKPEVTSVNKIENLTQVSESTIAQSSRNITDFLPAIFQTETNRQFITSTLDHLMSTGSTESIDRYWGRITGNGYSYGEDVFNLEHNSIRQNYQLAPGLEYRVHDKQKPVSYINHLNALAASGYSLENPDRTFSEPGYVLDLPINVDMFINYVNYYWMPMDLPVCDVEPTQSDPIDVDQIELLNTYRTPVLENGKRLRFFNGMLVRFVGDYAASSSGRFSTNDVYMVAGVGTGNIKLITLQSAQQKTSYSRILPYSPLMPSSWDSGFWDAESYDRSEFINIEKEYVVISAESIDQNSWSRCNVWKSIYAIEETVEYLDMSINDLRIPELMARRPIIEFRPNIRLYDSGVRHLHYIDHMITEEVDIFTDIIGKEEYLVNGYPLADLDTILVTNAGTRTNRIYRVSGVSTSIQLSEIGRPLNYEFKDKVVIINSDDQSQIGLELYWDNEKWYSGQQKTSRATAPLYELFCPAGTSLSDFSESTFQGSTIFGYRIDDLSPVDSELGFAAVTNSASPDEFLYDVSIDTVRYQYVPEESDFFDIPGVYHYRNLVDTKIKSVWNMLPVLQRVKKMRTYVADTAGETVVFKMPDDYGFAREYFVVSDSTKHEVIAREEYGFSRTHTHNPVIATSKRKEYSFTLLTTSQIERLEFTTPLSARSPYITVQESNGVYTLSIAEDYEYDTVLMTSTLFPEPVTIFIYDHSSDGVVVRKNGIRLVEELDYVILNGEIRVSSTTAQGDVYELEYIANEADIQSASDVAPVYRNNPGNNQLFDLGYSNLFNHFKEMIETNPLFRGSVSGRNNYHLYHPNYVVEGSIRQQIYNSSFVSVLADDPSTNILKAIETSAKDYALFKRFFKSKVQQLWETRTYYSVRELVDDALSEINIGKTNEFKYAYSDMAYYTSSNEKEYVISGSATEFTLTTALHSNGYTQIHLNAWIYDESSGTPDWKPLVSGEDFTVDFDVLKLVYSPQLSSLTSARLLVRIHDSEEYSYIPFSLPKLGIFSPVTVTQTGMQIICHDGSLHVARTNNIININAVDFDPVAASVYDLEVRIYNNIKRESADYPGRSLQSLLRYAMQQSISWQEINRYIEFDFNRWKQDYDYAAGYESITYDATDPFTWNYAEVTAPDTASWRTLYRKLFGTHRPHTHPWEMLGYATKPSWWDTHYSWLAGAKRQSLIAALKNGIVGEPGTSVAVCDPLYAIRDYAWDFQTLVTTGGELQNPVDAGIITDVLYDNRSMPFRFGDLMTADELGWRNSSEYMFSVLSALIKLKPVSTMNLFWKLSDYALVDNDMMTCAQSLSFNQQTREHQRGFRLHEYPVERNELTRVTVVYGGTEFTDGEITVMGSITNDNAVIEIKTQSGVIASARIKYPGSGYSNDFVMTVTGTGESARLSLDFAPAFRKPSPGLNALIIENMNSENSSELLSSAINSITDAAIIHLGGYSKLDLIDIQLDGSYKKGKIRIPKENIRIFLNKNPLSTRVFYSGVMIERETSGFRVRGYDESRKYFTAYKYNTAGARQEITVQENQIYRYTSVDDLEHVNYGTLFRRRQELYNFIRGLGEFYKSQGFANVDWDQAAFDALLWSLDRNAGSSFFINGVIDTLDWSHGSRGILEEIQNNRQVGTFILDENDEVIDFSDIVVLRKSEGVSIKFLNDRKLAGIELAVAEYEHLVSIDPVTKFNDFVFDKVLGIYQDRIKILGERTRDWRGLPSANGFIVRTNDIINNFDSTVREIERDYVNVATKTNNTLTRKTMGFNVGYLEPAYLSTANIDDATSFKFSVGDKKYKGTTVGLSAFMRNQNLFNSESDLQIDEEWMVRLGSYGDSAASMPTQFELSRSDVKSDPQLIRLNEYPRVDRADDDIIDITRDDSRYITGDFQTVFRTLPVRKISNLTIGDARLFRNHNQIAGLPLLNEVDYIVDSVENIPAIFDLSEEYANIGEWRSNVSYAQGDKVRIFGRTYELLANSTGLNSVVSPIVVRGSVLYPVVPNGSTLDLTITQGENTDTSISIQFSKTGVTNSYGLIVDRGATVSPSVPSGTTFVLDSNTITFSKRGTISTYQPVEYQGTTENITISGSQGKRLVIEGVTIDFQRFSTEVSNITLGDIMSNGVLTSSATEITIEQARLLASSRITALNSLRSKYILEEATSPDDPTGEQAWDRWLNGYLDGANRVEGYHSGAFTRAGLNTPFLVSEIAAADADNKPYLTELENLLSVDINIINLISGLSATTSSPPGTADAINASEILGASPSMSLVRSRIISGVAIQYNDILRTSTTVVPQIWQAAEIVDKINTAMIVAGRAVVASLSATNQLILTLAASDLNPRLTVSPASGNVEVGFPALGVNLDSVVTQTEDLVNLNISDVVDQINNTAISGVTAAARTVPGGSVLEITSNNRSLTIGTGNANLYLGINAGVRVAPISETIADTSLQIYDIVSQINNNFQSLGVSSIINAENINNTLLIRCTADKLTIGSGTANASLGIISNVAFEAIGEGTENTFNEEEWQQIPDPLDFSIWVRDNLGDFTTGIVRTTGYNVYQVFDFDYEIDEVCEGVESGDDVQISLFRPHYLSENDFVAVVNTNSSPIIDGIHRVTEVRTFDVVDEFGNTQAASNTFLIDEYVLEKGFGGKLFVLKPVRFPSRLELFNTLTNTSLGYYVDGKGWRPGMLAYVDDILDANNEQTGIAGVYRCVQDFAGSGVSFELIRTLNSKIDNTRIQNAVMYSGRSNREITQFEVYDPVKGLIPGIADREIDLKSPYDRAVYSNSLDVDRVLSETQSWGQEHVGVTWWDLSSAVYIDYEQSDLAYRQANWGRLYPTASIDVYEWTKSPVLPSEYSGAVVSGTVIDGKPLTGEAYQVTGTFGEELYYWSEKITFNQNSNTYETYYYFWVKNKTTLPNSNRTLTVLEIANILTSPSDYGINWVAACDDGALLVSNLNNCLDCEDAILQINVRSNELLDTHQEFILLSEKSDNHKIPDWLHDGMTASVSMRDKDKIVLKYTTWNKDQSYAKNSVVRYNSRYFLAIKRNSNQIPDLSELSWKELKAATPLDTINYWDIKSFGDLWDRNSWDSVSWDQPMGNIPEIDSEGYIELPTPRRVPDPWLHRFNQTGPDVEPRQSWISRIDVAQKSVGERINSMLAKINLVDEVFGWDRVLNSTIQTDFYQFDFSKLWVYTDWVREGFNTRRTPNHRITNEDSLGLIDITKGRLAQVNPPIDSDGISRKRIYEYQPDGSWLLVFKENATIRFVDELWDGVSGRYSWDNFAWDTVEFDANWSEYFSEILDVLRQDIFTDSREYLYKELWFSIIEYLHSEQDNLNWIIKSSYIDIQLDNMLNQDKKYEFDYIQNIIDYINAVKPYKTKIRNLSDRKSAQDEMPVNLEEITTVSNIDLSYNQTDFGSWRGDLLVIGNQTTELNTDSSEFTSEEFDYIYDGQSFANPAFTGWGSERYFSKSSDTLRMLITRNEVGSQEVPETTRQALITTDYRNRRYINPVSTDNTAVLSSGITANQTYVDLVTIPQLIQEQFQTQTGLINGYGMIWIDAECILFKNIEGTRLLNCVRGAYGTSSLSHNNATSVYFVNMNSGLPTEFQITDTRYMTVLI